MIKHISSLKRFDFTDNCKSCQFRKELGVLEYCCSFVYDIIQEQRLLEVKKSILDYVFFDDQLENIKTSNTFFNEDTEWSVTINFKTNLVEDDKIIIGELEKQLMKSPYFKKVYLKKLQKQENHLKKLNTLDMYMDMVI